MSTRSIRNRHQLRKIFRPALPRAPSSDMAQSQVNWNNSAVEQLEEIKSTKMGPASKNKGRKRDTSPPASSNAVSIRRVTTEAPNFNTPMILVAVGAQKLPISVHLGLITASSNFFKAALNGSWAESAGLVQLPEADPELFNIYVQYLYTGKVYSQSPNNLQTKGQDGEWGRQEWERLLRLHFLGDNLIDSNFQNATIDAMIEKWRQEHVWWPGYAALVYDNSCAGSAIRRLIVDFHVHLGRGTQLAKGGAGEKDAPKEFFEDCLLEFIKVGAALYDKAAIEPWDNDQCLYHYHLEDRCSK